MRRMGRKTERNDAFCVSEIDKFTSAVGIMTVEDEQSFPYYIGGGKGFENVGEPLKSELVIRPTVWGESNYCFRIVELAEPILKQPCCFKDNYWWATPARKRNALDN